MLKRILEFEEDQIKVSKFIFDELNHDKINFSNDFYRGVLEEYKSLVEGGIFPIYRGHILSPEDLIIRRHILNLMCKLETSWEDQQMQFSELPDVIIKLSEMQEDGLLKILENKIEITEKGRAFVRNVCMAFDLRLQRKKPDTKLFSMTI